MQETSTQTWHCQSKGFFSVLDYGKERGEIYSQPAVQWLTTSLLLSGYFARWGIRGIPNIPSQRNFNMFHSVIHEEEMTADHRQGRPQQFGPWSSSTLPWAFFPLIVQYLCFLVLPPASPSPLFLLGGQESIIK